MGKGFTVRLVASVSFCKFACYQMASHTYDDSLQGPGAITQDKQMASSKPLAVSETSLTLLSSRRSATDRSAKDYKVKLFIGFRDNFAHRACKLYECNSENSVTSNTSGTAAASCGCMHTDRVRTKDSDPYRAKWRPRDTGRSL